MTPQYAAPRAAAAMRQQKSPLRTAPGSKTRGCAIGSCTLLGTGGFHKGDTTVVSPLGVFFCFVFLHKQENEGLSGEDSSAHEQKEMARSLCGGGNGGGSNPPPYGCGV